jgi:hypothetical protein
MDHDRLEMARFQGPIVEVCRRSAELDLRAFEDAPAERLATELRPTVCEILRDARTLLAAILEQCGTGGPDLGPDDASGALPCAYLPFERAVDATLASHRRGRRIVEEVAFIAQLELRQRQERLERAKLEHGAIFLLGEADSSLRRVRKALSAVESAIASAEGIPPLLVFTSETELSLRVRRAYAKFRARLGTDREPQSEDLYARFRGAGTQIAMLMGWDVYRDLRIRDRLLLCDLQRRILSWLRGDPASTALDGLRLWQDLVSCAEMFALVSRRQELMEHDAQVVPEVLRRIRSSAGAIDAESRALLESLEGLDGELDRLLSARPRPEASAYIEPLERLLRSLGRPSSRPAPPEPTW